MKLIKSILMKKYHQSYSEIDNMALDDVMFFMELEQEEYNQIKKKEKKEEERIKKIIARQRI